MWEQKGLSPLNIDNLTEPFLPDFECYAISFEEADAKYVSFASEIQAQKRNVNIEMNDRYNQYLSECKSFVKSGSEIEVTKENLTKVLYGLNQMNWGTWNLPQMSIGYSAHQFDCNGKTATTIKLDTPINIDGQMISKFKTSTSRGHLEGYYSL